MSLMIVKVAPWRPARFRILRRIGCGTEPKASRRSSHTMDAGFFLLRESWKMDLRTKECSRHPSNGRKPFWDGLMMLLASAQSETLRATIPAYSLYRVFCSAMGLQLSKLLGSLPLWIRMVLDCFHRDGILPLILRFEGSS